MPDLPATERSSSTLRELSLLACPACGGALSEGDGRLCCTRCAATYPVENGVPQMLLSEPFEDEDLEERWENEENTGAFLTENYLIPLISRLYPGKERAAIRVLSIGCGVGRDVDVLNGAGFACYGIDAGNRAKFWGRRRRPERYFVAGAQKMPFKDGIFDFAFMNCVLPHIGVIGDTQRLKADFEAQRWAAVKETIRVVKPGGHIMVANPNRLCPLDLFHRPHDHTHIPRLHGPREEFLQSFDDLKAYFVERGQCSSARTLPITNYWGFFLSSKYGIGRVLQMVTKGYFKILSWPAAAFLLRTALNPWLVVLVKK